MSMKNNGISYWLVLNNSYVLLRVLRKYIIYVIPQTELKFTIIIRKVARSIDESWFGKVCKRVEF